MYNFVFYIYNTFSDSKTDLTTNLLPVEKLIEMNVEFKV